MMRNLKPGLFFLIFFLLFSCGPDTPDAGSGSGEDTEAETDTNSRNATMAFEEACRPEAEVLDGNSLLVRERGEAVFIAADSTTYDANLGESHRLILLMDMEKCELVDRLLLPVNESPDFPYQLADISYHRVRNVIAIKGLKTVLCYDMKSRKIFGPIAPSYKNEREYADAQSGNIERLEIWEDYIIGYATDMGAFAFVIEPDNSLTPYFPAVEFPGNGLAYRSLFLIPTADAKMQAVIPAMEDQPPYGFSIEALFEQPLELKGAPQAIPPRYGLLGRNQAGEQVVVDVREKKRIELPDHLKQASAEKIKQWLVENL